MPPFSFIASVVVRRAGGVLSIFVNSLRDARKYHPERHYMRGPGPKWREKHLARQIPAARGG